MDSFYLGINFNNNNNIKKIDMKDAKQFYKEHGLSEDTIIYINDLHWLVDNYYDEAPYIEDMVDLLGQAIRDSKIETVGDTIQCMDIRKKLLKIHKQTIT